MPGIPDMSGPAGIGWPVLALMSDPERGSTTDERDREGKAALARVPDLGVALLAAPALSCGDFAAGFLAGGLFATAGFFDGGFWAAGFSAGIGMVMPGMFILLWSI